MLARTPQGKLRAPATARAPVAGPARSTVADRRRPAERRTATCQGPAPEGKAHGDHEADGPDGCAGGRTGAGRRRMRRWPGGASSPASRRAWPARWPPHLGCPAPAAGRPARRPVLPGRGLGRPAPRPPSCCGPGWRRRRSRAAACPPSTCRCAGRWRPTSASATWSAGARPSPPAEWRHSVHVDVGGSAPGRLVLLPVPRRRPGQPRRAAPGRPRPGARRRPAAVPVRQLPELAAGYWPLWAHAPADDPDLVLHLGDYIYEGGAGSERRPPPQQRRDPHPRRLPQPLRPLQGRPGAAGHPRRLPVGRHLGRPRGREQLRRPRSRGPGRGAGFAARRAAAYQAWWEHQPVRLPPPTGPDLAIYRSLDWGRLARFHVLDTRQYRSDQPCGDGTGPDLPRAHRSRAHPARRRAGGLARRRAWRGRGPPGTCSPTRSS